MRAIVITPSHELELRDDLPVPEPASSQVRVRVRACGVNRADLLQRMGHYPAPPDAPADIPGLEVAGTIDAVGRDVTDLRVGDRVYGVVGGGAYAEHVVVHSRTLARLPDAIDFETGAAIPEAFLTAYDAIVSQAGLAAGETVLVHAAGSGVGTAAVQIARAVGARAIGTSRTETKLDRAKAFGLHASVLTTGKPPRFAERVRDAAKGGVDVVLELVGGDYVSESLACLAPKGRLVLVGLLAGARAEIDLGVVLRQRLRVYGTVIRARPLEEKIALAHVLAKHLTPLFLEGKLRAVVDRVLPLERAADAFAHMAANDGFGKIVLRIA